jgi:hypothetical protein
VWKKTALFYNAQPNRTLALKGETCHLLLFCHVEGSEKFQLLVMGKFENPQYMINIQSCPLASTWVMAKVFCQLEIRGFTGVKIQIKVFWVVTLCNVEFRYTEDIGSKVLRNSVIFLQHNTAS